MPKREYDWPTLMPEELSSVALQLSPSVQVCWINIRFPGGVVMPTWAAHGIIDGEVEAVHCNDCPIGAYANVAEWMVQQMAGDA